MYGVDLPVALTDVITDDSHTQITQCFYQHWLYTVLSIVPRHTSLLSVSRIETRGGSDRLNMLLSDRFVVLQMNVSGLFNRFACRFMHL